VFLDGRPFSRRYQIDNVVNAAAALHQSWRIIECVCPEEVAQQRLEEQSKSGAHPAGNRNFQLYLEVRSRFEAISLPRTVIDTSQPLEACIEHALAAVR
jgi:adenylylsulfate kinase